MARGSIRPLNLAEYQAALEETAILTMGSRTFSLLTGTYVRNANYMSVMRQKYADNPRFTDECDFAVLMRWASESEEALEKRARDVRKRLSDAIAQLPEDVPSIIHIGFETIEGDAVEERRYRKFQRTVRDFDYSGRNLQALYIHYFVPESPPDGGWAFDETTIWWSVQPGAVPLTQKSTLVLPPEAKHRPGVHWTP